MQQPETQVAWRYYPFVCLPFTMKFSLEVYFDFAQKQTERKERRDRNFSVSVTYIIVSLWYTCILRLDYGLGAL